MVPLLATSSAILLAAFLLYTARVYPHTLGEMTQWRDIGEEETRQHCNSVGLSALRRNGFAVLPSLLNESSMRTVQQFFDARRDHADMRGTDGEHAEGQYQTFYYYRNMDNDKLAQEVPEFVDALKELLDRITEEGLLEGVIDRPLSAEEKWGMAFGAVMGGYWRGYTPECAGEDQHTDHEHFNRNLSKAITFALMVEKEDPNEAGLKSVPKPLLAARSPELYEYISQVGPMDPDESTARDGFVCIHDSQDDSDYRIRGSLVDLACAPPQRPGDLVIYEGSWLHGTQKSKTASRISFFSGFSFDDTLWPPSKLLGGGVHKFWRFAYGDGHQRYVEATASAMTEFVFGWTKRYDEHLFGSGVLADIWHTGLNRVAYLLAEWYLPVMHAVRWVQYNLRYHWLPEIFLDFKSRRHPPCFPAASSA